MQQSIDHHDTSFEPFSPNAAVADLMYPQVTPTQSAGDRGGGRQLELTAAECWRFATPVAGGSEQLFIDCQFAALCVPHM